MLGLRRLGPAAVPCRHPRIFSVARAGSRACRLHRREGVAGALQRLRLRPAGADPDAAALFRADVRPALVAGLRRRGVHVHLSRRHLRRDPLRPRRPGAAHAADAARHRLARRPLPPPGATGGMGIGRHRDQRSHRDICDRSLGITRAPRPRRAGARDRPGLRRGHVERRAGAHSRTGDVAVDRPAGAGRKGMDFGEGAMRADAGAEGDVARAPRPRLPRYARRQPGARQSLFAPRAASGARAGRIHRHQRRDRSARMSARFASARRGPGWPSTTSPGCCHSASTRRSRSTCRPSPGQRIDRDRKSRTHRVATPVGRHPDVQQRGRAPALPRELEGTVGRERRRDHRARGRLPRRHPCVSRPGEPDPLGCAAPALDSHGRCA